ncbi:MAG: hypothetical protein AAF564_04720 [Bacteroidota bacterium]
MAKHDPVSALAEEDATGNIAEIFEDIRQTMRLPLLTSIWRILAADEAALEAVWQATKPIFESGLPEEILLDLKAGPLPIPPALVPSQLEAAGLTQRDRTSIQQILNVYNRSNSLNFLTLSALIAQPIGPALPATSPPAFSSANTNPVNTNVALPRLPTEADLPPKLWQFLYELNKFGAAPDEPGLATVWRHLAHWPGFLAVTHAAFAPLQNQGTIADCIHSMLTFAAANAGRMSHTKNTKIQIPAAAQQTISRYITHPGLVVRMVAIGLGLSSWLDRIHNPAQP